MSGAQVLGAQPLGAPYANTLVQYGGYYQPLGAGVLAAPTLVGGGYFAVPGVQPIGVPQPAFLQQPTIYYNNIGNTSIGIVFGNIF